MRQARFLPPRRRWLSRVVPLLGLVLTGWGCQQPPTYFYYGYGAPACVPVVPAPTASVNSKAGGPPTEVIEGGMTSAESPAAPRPSSGRRHPRGSWSASPRSRTRTAWRRNPDPDPVVATTSVEGGVRARIPAARRSIR